MYVCRASMALAALPAEGRAGAVPRVHACNVSKLRCARADLFVALIVLILFGFVASIFGGPILRKVRLGFLSTVAQLYPRPRDCRSVRRLAHTTYCKRRERQEWNTTCAWLSAFAVALARSTPRPAA